MMDSYDLTSGILLTNNSPSGPCEATVTPLCHCPLMLWTPRCMCHGWNSDGHYNICLYGGRGKSNCFLQIFLFPYSTILKREWSVAGFP